MIPKIRKTHEVMNDKIQKITEDYDAMEYAFKNFKDSTKNMFDN